MADNVVLNSGSGGATAAADDIGGAHHQRVKLSVGADGSASDAIPVSNGLDTTAAGVQAVGLVAQLDDVATGAVTENQFAPVRLSTRRALLVEGVASGTAVPISAASLPLPSGAATSAKQDTIIGHVDEIETHLATLAGAVSGTEMQVDVVAALPAGNNNIGDVDVASVVPGTGATNLGKAEDAVHNSGDVGVMVLAVRNDDLVGNVGADGDYVPLQTNSDGGLFVAQTGDWFSYVRGMDAHDDPLVENPLTVGGYASAAAPTSVSADGDAVRAWFLRNGAQATVLTAAGALIGGDAANGLDVDVTRVQGTVTVSATNLDIRDIDAATDDITIHGDVGVVDQLDLANTNPLAVAIVDGSGDQITSFGGGTQYTEDAAAAANPVGTAVNLIRADTPAGIASADGDNLAQRGTNFGAAYVTLLDTSGNPVAVGGGTQYTEDVAAAADPVGTAMIMVRDDALSGQTSADGDNVAARGTDKGELYVKHVDALTVTGVSTLAEQQTQTTHLATIAGDTTDIEAAVELIDDTVAVLGTDTYTETTTKGLIIGAVRRDADTTLVNTTNEISPLQVDANGRLKVEAFSGETLPVSVSGVSTLAEQQTQTTALQLIDDAIFTDDTSTHSTGTTKGVGIMAVATATDASVNANDIGMVGMTTDRKLHVAVMDALPAGTNGIGKLTANSGVDIGDVDVTTVGTITPGTAATSLGKAEDGGHTTGDVGVAVLGVRVDTPNTALTNADADYGVVGLNKLGSVRTAALEDDLATAATKHTYKYYTNAGAVTDGIIWSPAAGARWFLTSLTINTSAAATVTIEDDVAAGDVVRFKFEFAANSGIHMSFPVPMFSGEDAADLLVTTSAGNIYITAVGYEI